MRPDRPTQDSLTTRTSRQIAADPTSTALLLTAPAALELWPGVRRVGEVDGRALVETELPGERRTAATVRALPPRRTPTAFVTRFAWTGPDVPEATGELRLTYVGGHESPGTLAELVLRTAPSSHADGDAVHALAAGFLENLREAAEARSHAA
ncbi:MAG: hypothetical protein JWO60_1758 [Frankiales bacterium]|nr:hypothetical protein [Frankiales bacterium]